MEVHITDQLTACAVFAALGVTCGIVYDIMRAVRFFLLPCGKAEKSRFAAFIGVLVDFIFDILFMFALTGASAIFSFCFSRGKLRSFDVVSFCVAFFIYRKTLGRLVSALLSMLSRVIRRALRTVRAVISAPIILSVKFARRAVVFIFRQSVGRVCRRRQLTRQRKYFDAMLCALENDVAF